MIRKFLIFISLLITTMMAQSSIVIPIGASITVPENAYLCAETITVNGELIPTGSNVCNYNDAGAIASIIEASSLNENGYYKVGDQISVTLKFSRDVAVTGTPQLSLNTSLNNNIANYKSGTGTVTLTFNYIVQVGDVAPDLKYVSTTALSLNGGSIKDLTDRDSEILLPQPGAENSLSANKNIVVDGVIPIAGTINDGTGEDIDYSSSLTDMSFNWTAFDDLNSSGIKHYLVGVGSALGEVDVHPFVEVVDLTYNFSDLLLINGSTYYGVVKAVDKAGNISSIAKSNGVTVDEFEGPPTITTISPDLSKELNLINVPSINIAFSEPIGLLDLEVYSAMSAIDFSYELSSNNLLISILSSLTSRDEISLNIENITDLSGRIGLDQSFIYNTATLADFNQDRNVDAGDLSSFIMAWNGDDFTKELGPSTGSVPNLILSPDNKYDLEDVMGFSRMWHWSRKNDPSGKLLAALGEDIVLTQDGSIIQIDWQKEATVAQFEFIYQAEHVRINDNVKPSKEDLELVYIDTLKGVNTFAYANISNEKYLNKLFMFKVKGKISRPVNINYQFYSHDGELISQGRKALMLEAIPEVFTLHQNYPNPFNPITTISYDLPEETYVNLVIYDILGKEITTLINENKPSGYQSTTWNSRNSLGEAVSAGIYFYQIQTKDFIKTRKLVLLK